MLLDTLNIVLRETLEASVLISLLLVASVRMNQSIQWLAYGFFVGLLGAWFYAEQLPVISLWFDYVGQEVVNSVLQYSIFLLLLVIFCLLLQGEKHMLVLRYFMAFAVALAVVREGAEIVIFYSGYLQSEGQFNKAFMSGFIGLFIGICVGVILYYGIRLLPVRASKRLEAILFMLIGSGMVLQATQLLLQADWLPSTSPLWNSNDLLAETSTAGQLAYAVFGYESTPSVIEGISYLSSIGLFILLGYLFRKRLP